MFIIAMALILIGFGLLHVEIAVPGFGISGILGIILICCGMFLGLFYVKYFWVIIVIVLILLFIIIRRFKFPKRLILDNKNISVKEKDLTYLVGKIGVVYSVLKPIGTCVFDDEYYECYSMQGVIDKDTKVIVKEIKENKIMVIRKINKGEEITEKEITEKGIKETEEIVKEKEIEIEENEIQEIIKEIQENIKEVK